MAGKNFPVLFVWDIDAAQRKACMDRSSKKGYAVPMEIKGPNRTGRAGPAKKTGKAGKAPDGAFIDMVSDGGATQETGGAAATQSIARMDALLAVQGVEDPTERAARGRMHKRSSDLLDELEKVRMAMLTGDLTVGHMINVADVVASHREKIQDPELTAILDEIDLRAQVEIAKMRKSLEQRVQNCA